MGNGRRDLAPRLVLIKADTLTVAIAAETWERRKTARRGEKKDRKEEKKERGQMASGDIAHSQISPDSIDKKKVV